MLSVFIEAISISAPGFINWESAIPILKGDVEYVDSVMPKYVPTFLPANERRRTTPVIRLALQVAHETMEHSARLAQDVCAVFATSEGDTHIVDKICSALTQSDPSVSPTQFHNSVHNAPAGYWAMASQSHQASTSLSGFSLTYSVGLLEAATMVCAENLAVLLVAYDYPAPQPLLDAVPMQSPFGTGLLLCPSKQPNSLGSLAINIVNGQVVNSMQDSRLEAMRVGNPAARCLPLLQILAHNTADTVFLSYLDNTQLAVGFTPC